jgi:glycosyltransferase involved in cell wall biosynthesis
MPHELSLISFVVPAHNEEALLARTLASIHAAAAAAHADYELIVADDASTDHTAQIAEEHAARVVRVALRQIGAVRNAGAREATGDVLVFVDADTVLPPETLAAALAALRAGAIGGGAGIAFDEPVPLWAHLTAATIMGCMRMRRWAAGCFVFVRREAFVAVGGFDEEVFVTEELILSQALKRQGRFVILRERVVTSARKAQRHGFGEIVSLAVRMAFGGRKALRRREGLELWYQRREEKPGGTA